MSKSSFVINSTGAIRATPNKPIKRYNEAKANEGSAIEEIVEENSLNCEICGTICGRGNKTEVGTIVCAKCLEALGEEKELTKEIEEPFKAEDVKKPRKENVVEQQKTKKQSKETEKTDYSELEKGNYPA